MDQDERALQVVREYIQNLETPFMNQPHDYFIQTSYSKWAANEIMVYILSHIELSPIKAVEIFQSTVKRYFTDDRKGTIFAIAYDVATDILELVRCELTL